MTQEPFQKNPHRAIPCGHCAGVSRRRLLQLGATSALGLGFSTNERLAQSADATPRRHAVVLLWMQGGVSHLDTFDPKPDAPAAIRGPFKAINTNVPGIQLCEHLPRLARIADKIAFFRSMHHDEGAHERGRALMLDGCRRFRELSPTSTSIASPANDPQSHTVTLREVYGDSPIGRKCLAARQLVEAGAQFVTVEEDGWDHHFRAFDALRNRLPAFDRATSALIRDLDDRGLLDTTTVLFATEFGRSPRINNEAGREHHPGVFSCFLAGGGIPGGQVVGGSDARGEYPDGQAITPGDLFRIVFSRLAPGIQPLQPLRA